MRRPEVAVIAELKKQSPSKGAINADMDVTARALDYVHAGASALSVLTESTRFGGSLDDLHAVRQAMLRATRPIGGAPLLRKDFIFDAYQVREARANGADALLLIVMMLEPAALRVPGDDAGAAALVGDDLGREELLVDLDVVLDELLVEHVDQDMAGDVGRVDGARRAGGARRRWYVDEVFCFRGSLRRCLVLCYKSAFGKVFTAGDQPFFQEI